MEYDIESILEKYEDDYNPGPRPMNQGPRNMYNQGQLVQPNADGSRPGYSGTKIENNIRLRDNAKAYDVEIQRGPQTFRRSFNLKDYKKLDNSILREI